MKLSSICQAIDEQAIERAKRLGMERDALPNLPVVKKFATIVTGVRRSGKSTLLDQWTHTRSAKTLSVHFDDLRLSSFSPDDFLCYFSGLTHLSYKKFIIILLTSKPWTILAYSLVFGYLGKSV